MKNMSLGFTVIYAWCSYNRYEQTFSKKKALKSEKC